MENAEATDYSQLIPDVIFETGWSFGIAAGSGKYGAWLGEILTTAAIPSVLVWGADVSFGLLYIAQKLRTQKAPRNERIRETLKKW